MCLCFKGGGIAGMFAKAAAKKAAIPSNEPSSNKPVKIETEENLMLQSENSPGKENRINVEKETKSKAPADSDGKIDTNGVARNRCTKRPKIDKSSSESQSKRRKRIQV